MAEFPTYEEMGKKVAEKALDEFLYDGKSIREWMQIIASEDAISRQAVLSKIKEVCFSEEWEQFRVDNGSNGQRDFLINYIEQLSSVSSSENPNKCEDAISRQAVIKYIEGSEAELGHSSENELVCQYINELPPVTPQPKTGWIPVSEGLPKKFSYVNCTCRSLIDDRASWIIETCYVPQPSNSPYSDWGNIPMLNRGECEVIAWMYRKIPEPYKAESEE